MNVLSMLGCSSGEKEQKNKPLYLPASASEFSLMGYKILKPTWI